ncbi:phospholipid-binding protein MlaC [Sinimarinibacterium sp. NLF-5-8]|uniref:MlaC/ttg2D family ABC transporter substrate-binding protein n=1 Tax=Sinimarinibacterium sp. NLF-5-8 TaxID=2698684 RepID=UPI00137BA9D2|nr:ABC transporter substrate-binding protein [Sinimarinibacterium sp. NLF-5-8]QHS10526.1 ABC transporter substrate-binding protein [Sinimarinibacterium sp. NLF-5-8]
MKHLKTWTTLHARLWLILVGAVFASSALAASPDEIVTQATQDVRADIRQNIEQYQTDKSAFYAMVDAKIVPHVDTLYVAKVILGTHLKGASEAQVRAFETAFKDMLIRTYADQLLAHYDTIEINIKPARIDGKRATVDVAIVRQDGKPPIPVIFSMRQVKDDWKVWDIKAENISLVLNYRTQMDGQIKKDGLEKVTERLRSGQLNLEQPQGVEP